MPPARRSDPPVIRPEFGPTLPGLLHQRFGMSQRTAVAGLVALLLLAGAALAIRLRGGEVEFVHRGQPAFTLLYSKGVLERATPGPGEFLRLVARRDGLSLSVTVRPLQLAPYRGDVAGVLPLYAEHHKTGLRRRLAGFDLRDEGKARVGGITGYQLGFRGGSARRPIYGRDLLLIPERPGAREGVLVSLLQTNPQRALNSADERVIDLTKGTLRSFQFGTERV